MQTPVTTIFLAGGEGARMRSITPKHLHTLCGLPMLDWVMRAAHFPGAVETPIAIVSAGDEQTRAHYGDRLCYVQEPRRRGTGAALIAALPLLQGKAGRALVLAADIPLIQSGTLAAFAHLDCDAAVLTSTLPDSSGYGSVLRTLDGLFAGIVEEGDIQTSQQSIKEVRVSAYCFDIGVLSKVLAELEGTIGQGELRMGGLLSALKERGVSVQTMPIPPEEAMDINDRSQLADCTAVLRRRINRGHMLAGVTFIDPEAAYIDATVKIGRDCTIYPGVVLEGNTVIGEGTTLYPACRIVDSHIGRFCAAQGVVAKDAVVGDHVTLGPYVNLRPGARLFDHVKVGNYIEVKNSTVGEGSKLPHLSYIGDGDVGKRVNLGCGTVFVNYDGYKKHRTTIGDDAFIGCHTSLVAPVSVGTGSFTAAGSVITEDVPPDTLAIARAKQVNKINYIAKLRVKRGEVKE